MFHKIPSSFVKLCFKSMIKLFSLLYFSFCTSLSLFFFVYFYVLYLATNVFVHAFSMYLFLFIKVKKNYSRQVLFFIFGFLM